MDTVKTLEIKTGKKPRQIRRIAESCGIKKRYSRNDPILGYRVFTASDVKKILAWIEANGRNRKNSGIAQQGERSG